MLYYPQYKLFIITIMNFFLPKQADFFDLFEDMNKSLEEINTLLSEFTNNFTNFESYAKRAKEIENNADTKAHTIIEKLNKSFITPFDREDIYSLVHELDDIVDLYENVIQNILLYNVSTKLHAMDEFAIILSEAQIAFGKLLKCLKGGKHKKDLVEQKIKIHNLEDQADIVFAKSITRLFQNNTDAMYVLKQKDILEGLEAIMDKYQKLSNIIEGIMVKNG